MHQHTRPDVVCSPYDEKWLKHQKACHQKYFNNISTLGHVVQTFNLGPGRKLVARKYSADQYRIRRECLEALWREAGEQCSKFDSSPTLRFRRTYHSLPSLDVRGLWEDRQAILEDMRMGAVELDQKEHERRLEWICRGCIGVNHQISARFELVIRGLRHALPDLIDIQPDGLNRYVRGVYFQAARSELGVISGRLERTRKGTSFIAQHIIDNFGKTETPTEETAFDHKQRGVLFLAFHNYAPEKAPWSIPQNDAFYLATIHYGRPTYLASQRHPRDIFADANETGGALTIFGREVAAVLGSGAEIHTTSFGEVLQPMGQAGYHGDGDYMVLELLKSVEFHTTTEKGRAGLSFCHDIGKSLKPGEVVVTTLEYDEKSMAE